MNRTSIWIVLLALSNIFTNAYEVNVTELKVRKSKRLGFELKNKLSSKIDFKNSIKIKSGSANQVLLNGSGVTASDFDKDGLCDIFFAGLEKENKLYKNLGNFVFLDVSQKFLNLENDLSTAVAFADINNDSWPDLLIGTVDSGLHIYANLEGEKFEKLNLNFELNNEVGIYSIAISDIDRDGDLDVYLSTYRNYSIRSNPRIKFETNFVNGRQEIVKITDSVQNKNYDKSRFYIDDKGKIIESGIIDYMLINELKGGFKLLKINDFLQGAKLQQDYYINEFNNWGLGCVFADLNFDGYDDLYVCNDLSGGDFLYINKKGLFYSGNERVSYKSPMFSMGVDVADINNDGFFDIFVVDMLNKEFKKRKTQLDHFPDYKLINRSNGSFENNRNMLFLGKSDGTYDEIAYYAGLEGSDWSWCPIFTDVDLDGYQDVLITNGFAYDLENTDLIDNSIKNNIPTSNLSHLAEGRYDERYKKNDSNLAFRNNGDLTFKDYSNKWNFNFEGISQGACLADLDNDGDEDVIINNFTLLVGEEQNKKRSSKENGKLDGDAIIYENIGDRPRIRIKLELENNFYGIGATLKFKQMDEVQTRQIRLGSRYCSSDEPAVTFSIDDLVQENELEIFHGKEYLKIINVKPNSLITVYSDDFMEIKEISTNNNKQSIFKKQSVDSVAYHKPNNVNTDYLQKNIGRELIISEPIINFLNTKHAILNNGNNFVQLNNTIPGGGNTNFSMMDSFTLRHMNNLYLFELRSYSLNNLHNAESLINIYKINENNNTLVYHDNYTISGSFNCINWHGVNNEQINIILGGGYVLGEYPKSYSSIAIPFNLNLMGFHESEVIKIKSKSGVNQITITDLNNDYSFEIIFAQETGSIKILNYIEGQYVDCTRQYGLDSYVGNWNSLAVGDLNNDGFMDLIAGNTGVNNKYNAYSKHNLKLYSVKNGEQLDLYRTYRNSNNVDETVEGLSYLSKINPFLSVVFENNEMFFNSNFKQIFSKKIMNSVSFTELETCLFINKNSVFEKSELPKSANFYPVYGIHIVDINLDGFLDVFMCQNSYGAKGENEVHNNLPVKFYQNYDGSLISSSEINGDIQKGEFHARTISTFDFNEDCKPDILVGNIKGAYHLYSNASEKNGIKINLIGNDINLVGSKVMIEYSNGKLGPASEFPSKTEYRVQRDRSMFFGLRNEPINILIKNKSIIQRVPILEGRSNYKIDLKL